MTPLKDLAHVLRSKNSGPFAITLDILFEDASAYQRAVKSGLLTAEAIAKLYRLPPGSITDYACYDAALGIKVTFLRQVASGTVGDRDVYGAQQHAPLLDIFIP